MCYWVEYLTKDEEKALDESYTQFCKENSIKILEVPYAYVDLEREYV